MVCIHSPKGNANMCFTVTKQTGGQHKDADTQHSTSAAVGPFTYADVTANSLIPELLKVRQRFHRKEADIFEVVC